MTEESIFAEALQQPTPARRQAFLEEACAGDLALRQRVEALLRSHAAADNFLNEPALEQLGVERPGALPDEMAHAVTDRCPPLGATEAARKPKPSGKLPLEEAFLKLLQPPRRPDGLGRLAHYEVLEVLGKGGFGTVLKAFDDRLHRVVALKLLSPELAANATARERFAREARAAAAVRHENVISIHAVEDTPAPYLVMEYIDGPNLQQKVDQLGPLPVKEILRIGVQIAEGLAAAHKMGLIHRDIKPSNILLENSVERVKISDFSLARAVDDASLTQSGLIVGTPQFMSPEQAEGEHLDQRSDLFSLGSVLYTLCTGRVPFRASSTPAVLRRVSGDTPQAIRDLNPDIPELLDAIVRKLHAKKPDDRFPSARQVADQLAACLSALQLGNALTTPNDLKPNRVSGLSGDTEMRLAAVPTQTRPRHRRLLLPVTGILLAGLLAFLVSGFKLPWGMTTERKPDQPPAAVGASKPPEQGRFLHKQGGNRNSGIMALAYSPDGRTLAASAATYSPQQLDFTGWDLILWDTATGRPVWALPELTAPIQAVAFRPDGQRLATAGRDGVVRCWDVATGTEVLTLKGHTTVVRTVAWSPNGKWLATGGSDGLVLVWDAADGTRLRTFDQHTAHVLHLAFSPDSKRIASAANTGDSSVRVWETETGVQIAQFHTNSSNPRGVVFGHDGARVYSVGENPISEVWEATTGRLLFNLQGHADWVVGVALSGDGKHLATASLDGTARLWDPETGKALHVCPGHGLHATCVAFSRDGQTLASGDSLGQIHFWDAATGAKRSPP